MRVRWKVVAVAVPLVVTAACGQSNEASDSMGTKQTYELCPKTIASRQRLYEQVRNFADQQQARFIDRSAGVQRELSAMDSDVLKNTGGTPILITVEKSDDFRISVTNLGLKEKVALAVRSWGEISKDSAVTRFMKDLDHYWTVQSVDGSVTNDPPC